jgi:uncharacterized protein YaiI (UPF0178 family)
VAGDVVRSVLGPGVVVEEGASVRDSVLLGDVTVRRGAQVAFAIVDGEVEVASGPGSGAIDHAAPGPRPPITVVGRRARVGGPARAWSPATPWTPTSRRGGAPRAARRSNGDRESRDALGHADATPRDVKDIVVRAAERRGVRTVFVANQRVVVPPGQTTITAVRVDGGPDVADRYIAEHAAAGRRRDHGGHPARAVLVEKRVVTIGPRGEQFTEENVGERLSVRDFMDGLRSTGVDTGGPRRVRAAATSRRSRPRSTASSRARCGRAALGSRREHRFPRMRRTADSHGSFRERAKLLYVARVEEL